MASIDSISLSKTLKTVALNKKATLESLEAIIKSIQFKLHYCNNPHHFDRFDCKQDPKIRKLVNIKVISSLEKDEFNFNVLVDENNQAILWGCSL